MSNSKIEQSGTVKGHLPNGASLSGMISNGLNLSGHISIGGAGDFIIKMIFELDDDGNITALSCDATVEQIDAAVAAEKRVVVIAYGDIMYELPMLYGVRDYLYLFGIFIDGSMIIASVEKTDESTSEWQISATQIESVYVNYFNAALPSVANVEDALNALVTKSHSHDNKDILDKLSVAGGKLQYNGSDVGLKGDTPVKGTDYWTAADKTEIVNDALAALPTWTGGNY